MKKNELYQMKSRWLLFTLLTMMVGASPAWADELTVHDGTQSSYMVPLFGYRNDSYVKMEYILPSSELTTMAGGSISGLKYYLKSSESSSYGNANFVVFLKEVNGTTVSAFEGYTNDDIVYQGSLDATGETLDITFTKNYTYGGGNLLVGIYNTVKGTAGGWQVAYYYGETATSGASAYSYSSQSMAQATYVYKQSFLPKTTFTYSAANCKPVKNLAASNVGSSSADITWTAGDEGQDTWQVVYSTDKNFDKDAATPITVNSASYSLTGLESGTQYYVAVRSYCSEKEQSAWATTSFKTAKVAVPATGFTDDFETNKGWDLINGSVPNKWVRGTGTNNGGSYSLYVSSDGTTYPTSSYGGSSLVYATKLFNFAAGDYTISYDWKCYGEGTYDFLRVALIPGDTELAASTSYSSLGSGSTLPSGWTMWLDGGSKLGGSTTWATKSVDFTIETAGNYQVVFAWRNDGSSGSSPAAIDNVKIIGAAPVLELSGDVVGSALAFGSVSETTNKTIRITNSGKVAMENITLTETADADNVFAYAELPKTTLAANEYMDVQVTFSGSSAKDYTGTFRVAADDCDPIDVTVTATYSNSAATMAITLGEEAVGTSVAFGNVGKQAAKSFTVTNDGDQTLNVTVESNNTTDFTVTPAALAVTGHSSETFTVTFVYPTENPVLDTEKSANITITPSNEGIAPVTFTVTGTLIEQWSEDFSGNALPDGWSADGNYWTFADGVVKSKYNSYQRNNYLFTPLLIVESTSASLTFDYTTTAGSVSIPVYYSKDGGDYTAYSGTPSGLSSGVSGTFTITGLEAGNYRFRFGNDDYNLDNFQGFKRNMNDPKLGIYSDEACTTAIATSVTMDFGFVTETQTATYYIKNDGTGTMTLTLGDAPDDITQNLDKTSVPAGEHATLTITMPAENKGYNSGNVVVTATDLGTFTVAVSGVIVDDTKMNLNFASDNIPSTWTANDWMKDAGGYIKTGQYGYSNTSMETTKLTATAGEQLVVVAKNGSTSSSYTFGIKYKKVDAQEWSDLIAATNIGTSWTTLVGTIAESGDYLFQFNGYYANIQRIYGLSEPQEPVMVVYDGESVAAATHDFGNVSDENDATWTLTVKNEGKAELKGLAAALTGDNAAHYSVEVSSASVAVDGTATITVKQLKDNLGSHSATLTISATGLDNKVIALSGNTYDHTKMFVDFEDGNLPTGWTKGSYWNVSRVSGQTNYSLGHSYGSSYASSVITTPLTVAENETLTFGASRYYSNNTPKLKVRYTTDGGLTWSEYVDFSSEIASSYSGNTFKELTLTNVPAGTVVLEFYGNYVRLDNIYGFTPTTAPLLALTEGNTAVTNNSTKEFGTLTAAGTATYTLTNNGNGDMVSTVATTGVATAAISGEADGVTISDNKVTLAAGKSATITLTLPYAAPYGEKEGAMTISTEGWVGDFTVNYTATTVDPTALYIDFADNTKPEGWYNGGWYFNGTAYNSSQTEEKDLISSLLTVAGAEDVLAFDARAYFDGYTESLTVSYSTDRQNWTNVLTLGVDDITGSDQQFEVKGLNAGNYYLKFTGKYVRVDNILGWHYATPVADHDLYVSATTFPTTALIPGTESGFEATVTVNSLRANETGVYAKLFFDDEVIATTDGQDINKDASKTFSITANVPATEKTYAAKIVVYYSDGTEAWETPTTDVTVSHTRTLEVTEFALTSDATVEADENNQFSATFTVKVKNTGTTAVNVAAMVKDANGEFVGSANTTEPLAVNAETTLTITETVSAGEGGELNYYASAWIDNVEFTYETPVTITVSAQAPKFELAVKEGEAINDGDAVAFGLVKEATTRYFTITNSGTKELELVSIVAPDGYEATAVTNENKTIAVNGTLDIEVTLLPAQGKVSGNLVFTYKVDANTNKTFTLVLSGRSISKDTWTVAFDGTQTAIPSDWTNNGGWSIAGEYSSYPGAAYATGYSASWLATPRLAAAEGEELTYNVAGNNLSMKVEYSTNFVDWTEYETVTAAGEHSFVAPAAGSYYVRFTDTYAYLTNFVGFKLNPYTDITLDDTKNFNATDYVMGPCGKITIGRSFNAGWGTVVLPFDVDANTVQEKFGDGTKLYTLTVYNEETGQMTFGRNTDGNIVAGTPYLINLPAKIDAGKLVFENITMKLDQNNMTIGSAQFKGNYEAGMSMAGKYGVTPAGKLQKGASTSTMKAFRAYIELPENAPAARIAIDETGTTGITYVLGDELNESERTYNLQGQRVESPRKGFFIVGGKKVFKK